MRTSKLNIFTSFVFGALVACVSDSSDPTMYLTGTEEQAVQGPNGLECDDSHKVLICHIPPGNPDNAHTICVDQHALKAHQTHHGDNIGACAGDGGGGDTDPPDGDGGGDTDPPPDGDGGGGGGTTDPTDPPPGGGGTTDPTDPPPAGDTTPPGTGTFPPPGGSSVPTDGFPQAQPTGGGSSGPVV